MARVLPSATRTPGVTVQASLFEGADAEAGPVARPRRTTLERGAWVDHCPAWLPDPDAVFTALHREVPWRVERRPMYDRVVDVPRLLCFYGEDDPLPHDELTRARDRLGDHYQAELGERFATAGLCLYRDGRDSVAWHGDRIGRGRSSDTMVAIVSLGECRPLLLRPEGGGPSLSFPLGHGDLLVMGGSCQRTYQHCVPKTNGPCGPRISVQFRPRGVH